FDAACSVPPCGRRRMYGPPAWSIAAAMRRAEGPDVGRRFDGDWRPDGGGIEREGGRAAGVFVDGAMALVQRAVPPPDEAWRARALEQALQAAVANGLTGVHDMGVSRADLALRRRFADEGLLPLRIIASAHGHREALADLSE